MKYMRRRQKKDEKDTTFEEIVHDYLQYRKIEAGSEDDTALRFMLDVEILQDYAAPLSELSLKYWDVDDEYHGGDSYLAVGGGNNGGYSAVVERYAESVRSRIRLQTKVTQVEYGRRQQMRHVEVYCVDALSGQDLSPICAKHVIVTLPLGVLQEGSVTFSPELPEVKRKAICALGNGLMNKVALYWDHLKEGDVFWPKGNDWILSLAPPNSPGISEFYNPCRLDDNQRCLIGFVVGEKAEEMEQMSDFEIIEEALTTLRGMFGVDNVPAPSKSLVTRWKADEFSRGSYSFQKVGSRGSSSRRNLASSVKECLWFAGEATDVRFPSTTHGAYLSGEKAAKGALSVLRRGF